MTQIQPPEHADSEREQVLTEKEAMIEGQEERVGGKSQLEIVDEKASIQPVEDGVRAREMGSEADEEDDAETPVPRTTAGVPTWRKRLALAVLLCFVLYIVVTGRKKTNPTIIYASRYSKEHKFRPAASPIITETLKDGRIRLRGAHATAAPTPTVTPAKIKKGKTKKRKQPGSGKMSAKRGGVGSGGTGKPKRERRK